MMSSGVFHTATRYENQKPRPEQPEYLIVYETDWEDPAKVTKAWNEGFQRVRASGHEQPNDNLVRFFPAALYKAIFVMRTEPDEEH